LSIFSRAVIEFARSAQIDPLHIDRRDLTPVLQFDDPIVSLIAADRFVCINRLRDLKLGRFPALNQVEHQRRGPNLHGGGPFAHI
jgi:hypothetical protein